jgi:hypothetical protein
MNVRNRAIKQTRTLANEVIRLTWEAARIRHHCGNPALARAYERMAEIKAARAFEIATDNTRIFVDTILDS